MKNILVHKFLLGDVEDVAIYAAEPLYQFEKSEKGQWVFANALETPEWFCNINHSTYNYIITVVAKLGEENATFFQLKWG